MLVTNGTDTREVTGAVEQAYKALEKAAERIGENNYRNGLYRVKRDRKGRVIQGYTVTAEHVAVIEAMAAVLDGSMSPEQAMNLLWNYDVFHQRIDSK